ncbi:PepSY domain-containing protein [Halomonas sp. M20]|uniref:PepSY domain-containing protein n=1 Tax=Halomonas sp. M20 TaxID=2763264 RepID=UPI001D0BD0DB|nr:PepSY domain-containing protein [Halomonas sp. M20]
MFLNHMPILFKPALALGLVVLGIGLIAPSQASDWRGLHDEVQSGRLVALSSVLDWLEAHYLGEVLEVEVEHDDGKPRYEVEMIGPQGQLVEFEFDATNGELIGIEGVNIDAMQRP